MREGGAGLSLNFQRLCLATVSLPFFGFFFCLLWSLIFDFEKSTETHCEEPELLPSISSVIGGHIPQKHVWNMCIALHCAPRFLFAKMYKNFFHTRLLLSSPRTDCVIRKHAPQSENSKQINNNQSCRSLNFYLNVIENVALLGLSFVPSDEIFHVHATFFVLFIVCSILYMGISTFHLMRRCGYQIRSRADRSSLYWKQLLIKVTLVSVLLASYFYWRHNEYCEPYVYSLFALFEYSVVLCNMGYHATAYYDFTDWAVLTVPPREEALSQVK